MAGKIQNEFQKAVFSPNLFLIQVYSRNHDKAYVNYNFVSYPYLKKNITRNECRDSIFKVNITKLLISLIHLNLCYYEATSTEDLVI